MQQSNLLLTEEIPKLHLQLRQATDTVRQARLAHQRMLDSNDAQPTACGVPGAASDPSLPTDAPDRLSSYSA